MNIKETLKSLCTPPGVAGCETAASKAAQNLLLEYMPNAQVDSFGTVTGSINYDEKLPLLLLDAHIDEIGMVVNYIDGNGFLKVSGAGGIDRRALSAQTVTIWGKTPVKGVICALPPHVQTQKDAAQTIKEDQIAIDCGFTKEEVEKVVSLGDSITIDAELTELQNDRITARALDDRAGVCSILYALDLLKKSIEPPKLQYNLAVTFSSQEELGCRGARIAAYNINPDLAVAVDVSYGDYHGCKENKTGKIGGGVMLGTAPSLDRELFENMKKTATEKNIPYQIEVMSSETGTNADVISLSRKGVKCALLSIPLRNMHTPAEMLQISDIKATGQLIAEFIGAPLMAISPPINAG
ncbi:MAG: M20/M25/M40 family metallo-hydrolase [Oscillospiraceae bacterium]|nr:M20/M25/M40 family metallo-hydrolase [Oscillospiraceae bacterium]